MTELIATYNRHLYRVDMDDAGKIGDWVIVGVWDHLTFEADDLGKIDQILESGRVGYNGDTMCGDGDVTYKILATTDAVLNNQGIKKM